MPERPALILRTQREQEAIEGRTPVIDWKAGDYAVLDGETVIGDRRRGAGCD